MSEDGPNTADEIYDDLEIVSEKTSTFGKSKDCGASSITADVDMFIEGGALNEDELKKNEVKLYTELLMLDNEKRKERKEKQLTVGDYKKIQNEVLQLQKVIAEKDEKIAELSKKLTNLQMNVCSLYKTAKSESDQKDFLLKEANAKLDKILYKRNLPKDYFEKQSLEISIPYNNTKASTSGEGKCSQTNSAIPNKVEKKSDNKEKKLKQSSAKRSRSPSVDTENHTYPNKRQNCDSKTKNTVSQSISEQNVDKIKKCDSNSTPKSATVVSSVSLDKQPKSDLDSAQNNLSEKNSNLENIQDSDAKIIHENNADPNVNLDTSQSCKLKDTDVVQLDEGGAKPNISELFSKMQEEAFKYPEMTDLLFFNFLPDALKQSFKDYESSQVQSMNKLKQSFVNCYFQQCSERNLDSSKENTGKNTKTSFFFEHNFAQPEPESSSSTKASPVVNKPRTTTIKKDKSPALISGQQTGKFTNTKSDALKEDSNTLITID